MNTGISDAGAALLSGYYENVKTSDIDTIN